MEKAYPILYRCGCRALLNGHIFLLLAIEAHLELLVTNAVPQRKMATAMAARSPSPRSSICATWPAVAGGAPADGGRQEPAAAGGAPAAGPAGGGRSGRRRSGSTGPGCSAREERAWRREIEKEEHSREQIKTDVSRGEKNDTAYQSNPIRVKWVFYVPRERKTLTKFVK